MEAHNAALPADVAALLADYFYYADLAEHVRALPDAVAVLGLPNAAAERNAILAELDGEILIRLKRLKAFGLYPTLATDVEVTVNGAPVTLPNICRESTHALPPEGSVTKEVRMHTALEAPEEQHSGLDQSTDTPNGSGFFAAYLRPYLPYVVTFAVGAVCGGIGIRHFSNSNDGLEVRA